MLFEEQRRRRPFSSAKGKCVQAGTSPTKGGYVFEVYETVKSATGVISKYSK
jgi:hypothetical protein